MTLVWIRHLACWPCISFQLGPHPVRHKLASWPLKCLLHLFLEGLSLQMPPTHQCPNIDGHPCFGAASQQNLSANSSDTSCSWMAPSAKKPPNRPATSIAFFTVRPVTTFACPILLLEPHLSLSAMIGQGLVTEALSNITLWMWGQLSWARKTQQPMASHPLDHCHAHLLPLQVWEELWEELESLQDAAVFLPCAFCSIK